MHTLGERNIPVSSAFTGNCLPLYCVYAKATRVLSRASPHAAGEAIITRFMGDD
jgi:hypothetical protein